MKDLCLAACDLVMALGRMRSISRTVVFVICDQGKDGFNFLISNLSYLATVINSIIKKTNYNTIFSLKEWNP